MGAFNQLNGAMFDAGLIEARINAVDGKGTYNLRDGSILDLDSLARRLTALDGKIAAGQGGIEFDVDTFMRRLAAIEAGGFTPLSLFAQGQLGVWYDPSDFSTMFQDSAGTTPVTAVGQPVGKLLDKSGRANHAVQATAANRPVLQQDANGMLYLAFNGTNSYTATASNFDLSGTAQITVWSGVSKQVENNSGTIMDLSDANPGGFYLRASAGGAANYQWSVRSATTAGNATPSASAPDTSVLTLLSDLSAPLLTARRNGVQTSSSAVPAGGGNFGTYPFYLGTLTGASLFFNGRIYSLIVRGTTSTNQEVANAETWVNGKTRAY